MKGVQLMLPLEVPKLPHHRETGPRLVSVGKFLRIKNLFGGPDRDQTTKGLKIGFVYGSLARGEEGAGSDVDLMLIGAVSTMDNSPKLRAVKKAVGRQINPTVFSIDEFSKNLAQRNHFLKTVMRNKKITLVGTEDDLETIARGAEGAHAPDEQTKAR
jgi:hypothetical protein